MEELDGGPKVPKDPKGPTPFSGVVGAAFTRLHHGLITRPGPTHWSKVPMTQMTQMTVDKSKAQKKNYTPIDEIVDPIRAMFNMFNGFDFSKSLASNVVSSCFVQRRDLFGFVGCKPSAIEFSRLYLTQKLVKLREVQLQTEVAQFHVAESPSSRVANKKMQRDAKGTKGAKIAASTDLQSPNIQRKSCAA